MSSNQSSECNLSCFCDIIMSVSLKPMHICYFRVNKLSEPVFTSYHARDVNKWFRPMLDPRAMERSAEWEGKAGLQPSCTWGDKMKGSETLKINVNKRGYFMLIFLILI